MAVRFGGDPAAERTARTASGCAMRSVGRLWLLGAAICVTSCSSTTPPARTPQGSATNVGSGPASKREQQEESASATAAPPASAELSGGAKDAYDRGFQLWMTGDLEAARSAFSEAA